MKYTKSYLNSKNFIMEYLGKNKDREFIRPTEIARAYSDYYDKAFVESSLISKTCLSLVADGYLIRSEKGRYRLNETFLIKGESNG